MNLSSLKISTILLISQFIISTIGIGSVASFAMVSIYHSARQDLLRDAENLAYALGSGLEYRLAGEFPLLQTADPATLARLEDSLQSSLSGYPATWYAIYQADGRLLASSQAGGYTGLPAEDWPAEINAALAGSSGSAVRLNPAGQQMLYAAATIEDGAQVFGMLQIEQPYQLAMAPTLRLMRTIGLLAVGIVAFIMLVSWRLSLFLSRPVVHLSQVAEKLSQSNFTARAELHGPLETIHLAITLNTMAGRLHTSLEAMQSFVANASHELRTPLTSIKLQVGALLAGAVEEPEIAQRFLNQMDCEIDRLVYTVNEMLDLSQIEGSVPAGDYQPVDLLDLAAEVQALWEVRSQQAQLKLSLQHEPHLPRMKGDAFRLRRLLDNLVDNAIKNTPPGGQVQIVLRRSADPNRMRMEIRDTGIGIESQHLPHIFERFYRINPSSGDQRCPEPPGGRRSSGSGLGLAIARSIVLAHHGEIGVESRFGSGSVFWVELPVWTN